MKLMKQGHCAYKCEYHLILVTKYRRKVFNEGSYVYFQEIMKKGICEKIPEVKILEMNHDSDHTAKNESQRCGEAHQIQ